MSNTNPNNRDIIERLAVLETKVDEIVKNHLPHIDQRITGLENRQNQILGGLIITLIGVIVNILLMVGK